MGKDRDEMGSENVNTVGESDYHTEESKRKFIHESFKIDENKILNQDEKLKEEVVKLLLDNFSALALHKTIMGKQIFYIRKKSWKQGSSQEIQGDTIEPESESKFEGTDR